MLVNVTIIRIPAPTMTATTSYLFIKVAASIASETRGG